MFVWKRRDRRMDESRVVLKYNEGIPAMNKETEEEIHCEKQTGENYLEITKCQKTKKGVLAF